MQSVFEKILSSVFPRRCAFCSKIVENGQSVCYECLKNLDFVEGEICKVCGREKKKCQCNGKKFEFTRCVSPFYYKNQVRKGIIYFKFRARETSAKTFADYCVKTVKKEYDINVIDYVTAVPLTAREKAKRGYNQAELIARNIADGLNKKYKELLKKPYDIKEQSTLRSYDRWNNVKNAFVCLEKCKGIILLVDDIITTGATLNDCARALKEAGAEKVFCVTVACTDFQKKYTPTDNISNTEQKAK